MTQYDTARVPRWLVLSLQSYAFLSGAKWIEEEGARIHERVRQNDLKRLMKLQLPRNMKVFEDPAYKLIAPMDFQSTQWKGDLAVRARLRSSEGRFVYRTRFMFELKFQDANSDAFDRDLYKLAKLYRAKRARKRNCRSFLVVLGRGAPHQRFADFGRPCIFHPAAMPTLRGSHVTRGIFTATAIGSEHNAHYVCLVEVTA